MIVFVVSDKNRAVTTSQRTRIVSDIVQDSVRTVGEHLDSTKG